MRRFDISHLFERVIVSCEVGYRKPYPPIFMELLRVANIPAKDLVFVGDSYIHDIETPERMGMKTYYLSKDRSISDFRRVACGAKGAVT